MQKIIKKRIRKITKHYFLQCSEIISIDSLPKGFERNLVYLGGIPWKVCLGYPYNKEEVVFKQIRNNTTEEKQSLQAGLIKHLKNYGMESLFPHYYKLITGDYILQIDNVKIICQKFIQGNRMSASEHTSDLMKRKSAQFLAHFHKISSAYIPMNQNHYQNKVLGTTFFTDDISRIIEKYKIRDCDIVRNYFNEYLEGFEWKNEYEDIHSFDHNCFHPFKNKITEYKKHLCNTYGMTLPVIFLYIIEEWLHYNIKKYYMDIQKLNHNQFIEVFIHGDFSTSNILIDSSGKNICGLVDFDNFRKEIRLLDLINMLYYICNPFPDFTEKTVTKFLAAYCRECVRLQWIPLTATEIRAFYTIFWLKKCRHLKILSKRLVKENISQQKLNKYERLGNYILGSLIWLDGKINAMDMDAFVKKIFIEHNKLRTL